MDKNKIIKTYLDFVEGKFMSSSERINFPKLRKDAMKFISENIAQYDENDKDYRLINNEYQSFFLQKLANIADYCKFEDDTKRLDGCHKAVEFITKSNYYLLSTEKRYKVKNESIYAISNKSYNYFLNIPLPENFTEIDYLFSNDLPALFIFENGDIVYLDYLTLLDGDLSKEPELTMIIFSPKNITKYFSSYVVFKKESLHYLLVEESEHPSMNRLSKQEKSEIDKYVNLEREKAHFMCNLLLFLKIKETLNYVSDELNPVIVSAQNNIKLGKNINRNNQIIKQAESYKFVDLDLTLSEYSNNYYRKNPVDFDNSGSKKPHWRTGHWHSYWTGKRDGSEDRKKKILFVPTTWVGDPLQKQEQTIFKIIK